VAAQAGRRVIRALDNDELEGGAQEGEDWHSDDSAHGLAWWTAIRGALQSRRLWVVAGFIPCWTFSLRAVGENQREISP
jgi:hypothetical protein